MPINNSTTHPVKLSFYFIPVLAIFLLMLSPAHGQQKQATMDYTLAPTYGEVTLGASFGSSPHQQTITSGGDINSSYHGNDCTGFVSAGPDFRLHWNGSTSNLAFYFQPNTEGQDATILVNLPDGTWVCNDDFNAEDPNPMAVVTTPAPGQYDVWVGSYEQGKYIEGTLYIADLDKYEDASAISLDFDLDPQYSTFNLKEGFSPDPFSISGTSGGEIEVKNLSIGTSCIGYASKAPDFRLNWTGSTAKLRIRFETSNSSDDTILIINTPDGSWLCNDDANSNTLNPSISLRGQSEGQFDIWVASLNSGAYHEGKLIVTER
jgi:hypothetical protein